MATKIGPKTVTQRDRSKALVFCIDAAHSDSYGGQPFTQTVNALPEDATVGAATWTNTDFGHGLVGGIWHQETTGNQLYRGLVGSSFTPTNSGVCTFSCYVWIDVAPGNYIKSAIALDIDGVTNYLQANGSWSTVVHEYSELLSPTKQGEWHRISTTITFPSSGTLAALNWGNFYRNAADFNLRIANLQIESGSVATRYSSTSRTTTNTITNISGVGAQGTDWIQGSAADTYGQQLHKAFPVGDASTGDISQPRVRNVNATVDPNQGHIGGAYWDFDGTDEYISVASPSTSLQFNGSNCCVSAWMKTASTESNWHGLVVRYGSSADFFLAVNAGGATRYVGWGWSGSVYLTDDTTKINDGAWHHVVGQRTGDLKSEIYVDGNLVKSNYSLSGGATGGMNTSQEMRIGHFYSYADRQFDGEIATVMIWASDLTAKEIKDIYIAQKGRFGK